MNRDERQVFDNLMKEHENALNLLRKFSKVIRKLQQVTGHLNHKIGTGQTIAAIQQELLEYMDE